jgi:hypothetical protein
MASWVFTRDQITIGPALTGLLAAETAAGHLSPKDSLIFLAREVTQSETWVVPDEHNVLIVADRYLTTGNIAAFGAPMPPKIGVDTRGTVGALGGRGPVGKEGAVKASGSTPGEPGGPGGLGTAGTTGRSITLFAQTLFPVMLNGAGGAGGPGGIGGGGGDGARGRLLPRMLGEIDGSLGGNGGPGGAGASGGAAGNIRIVYVEPGTVKVTSTGGSAPPQEVPIPLVFDSAWVKGGAGGAGGPGGSPGHSFTDPPWPNAGPTGLRGVDGKDGALPVQQVLPGVYWEQLRASLVESARDAWARFRYAVGRFYYRSFLRGDPQRGNYLALARTEFLAVTELSLGTALGAAAEQQVAYIDTGLNALGLPRAVSIKPDFDRFEQTVVQYAPLVEPLFRDAKTLLLNAVELKNIGDQLRTTMTAVSNSVAALDNDMQAAQAELAIAQLNSNELDGQLNEIQAKIAAAKADLHDATFALEAAGPESLAIGIFSQLLNIIPQVKAAQGVVGVLVKTNNDPSLRYLLGTDDLANPLGGLAFAINEVGLFWGLGKSQADIAAARITGDKALIRDLMSRLVTVIFERKRQGLETTAASRRLGAAQARVAAARDDVSTLQQAIGANVADLDQIASILQGVLVATARLGELVVRNVFLAARALDILSFNNHTVVGEPSSPVSVGAADRVRLDFGLVQPDKVADAMLELQRGGAGANRAARAAAMLALLDELIANWSQAPDWIRFRDEWNTLALSLTTTETWISIDAASIVQTLKQTGRVVLPVTLDQLPRNARELRTRRVRVVLAGATLSGAVPSVVADMTHGGYAFVRRWSDGAELIVDGPALSDFVSVSTSSSLLTNDTPNLQRFFGRSPATTWILDVTEPVEHGMLSLDGLSVVQLGVKFDAIEAP